MSKVIFKAKCKQFTADYLLIPATPADKMILNSFCREANDKYITVTANYSRSLKTYDQCKTVFALIDIYFYLKKGRYPTKGEQALTYSQLLWDFAPRTESPVDPDKMVPISLSEMNKEQAAVFVNSIMGVIYELQHGLTDSQEVQLKEIFEEFQSANGFGDRNPFDYDDNGNMLTEEEWREKNHFSFASGVVTEDLQLHHIVSKGARPDVRDYSWNWIMLTNHEHINIYHQKGWYEFLSIYPHCAKRIKNAFDMAHQLYPLDLQKALNELGLSETAEDATLKPSFDSMEELATQALE